MAVVADFIGKSIGHGLPVDNDFAQVFLARDEISLSSRSVLLHAGAFIDHRAVRHGGGERGGSRKDGEQCDGFYHLDRLGGGGGRGCLLGWARKRDGLGCEGRRADPNDESTSLKSHSQGI